MKKYLIFFIIIIAVLAVGIFVLFRSNFIQVEVEDNQTQTKNEIIPEEEISDEQLRKTSVNLFFVDKDNKLSIEKREVDVKEIVNDPYKVLISMLIKGPENDDYKSLMPKDTQVLSTEKVGDILEINFNKAFVDNCEKDAKKQELLVKSILMTVGELREIEGIKILIEKKSVGSFMKGGYNLSNNILMK